MAIVVGHLGTPEGKEALVTAVSEARQREVGLLVVTSGAAGAAEELEALGTRLSNAGIEHRIVAGTGDLAEDLVRTAAEEDGDLIVIGLRRRSPVGKLILGSGAQRILLEAPCPVLAVKP
ncbi:nucleotide-binding universal stress UspA family protein [Isoptericola sp. CG 20/1183]|uniref:Nucleotide-binding universal stress UspA family protein n=1 Tax=Isoptericola halotolerans TaxID=300560 RepID=A0ABX5EAL4_9MICO|nr:MULTISPECIES: universal stress protein [Isoptericola]MCK0115669.1 universal stress protein [Isoptericola sp. S6320L]PRZ03880.1 nucleotide-binding universal stress UspA family protein [Isoptericola sp. CG 20/1183]PRZ03987.1 nucleotide-binding universal stress UspA family protein [Isoptericola halotolerans]